MFFESIIENFGSAAAQTITAQFAETIAESVTVVDSSTQQSVFKNTVIENIYLLDLSNQFGWIKINDVGGGNWTPVDNKQG